MTSPPPDSPGNETSRRLFYGRKIGPLFGPWIACLLIGGAVFFFENRLPVFHDVVQIIYFILLVVLTISTGRWFRSRRGHRRHADRRKTERRASSDEH
ncbi:MAG TPA: hypothetical protein VHM24_09510 [Gemmatimonadaceae bacterium]|nr:hypothetical protein [Gemmatimonadaceae bacterium]